MPPRLSGAFLIKPPVQLVQVLKERHLSAAELRFSLVVVAHLIERKRFPRCVSSRSMDRALAGLRFYSQLRLSEGASAG